MRYGSVCSGIEAASVAWHPRGWQPAFFSEIENFPRAVLHHRFPNVPLHGDFTTIKGDEYGAIDLLVGGTPCQSFSIAGLRGGLDDDRGNLALEFIRLADRTRPRWVVWENVPGVLSSNGGRDFGSILGGLGELGYGWAYRVLDAQFFGVAQRRRRVFVVGYLGDWRRAAAVLFERHSLSGHPAPRREAGEGVAGTLKACAGKSGTPNGAEEADRLVVAQRITTGTGKRYDAETETLVPVAFDWQSGGDARGLDPKPTAQLQRGQTPAVAFSIMPMNSGRDYKARPTDVAQPIMARGPVGENQGGDFVAQLVDASAETMYGVSHADASKARPDQELRALRQAVGEEAYSQWCAGILAAFRTPEILRSKVHGRSIRWARNDWDKLGDDALSCEKDGSAWPMLALWQAGCVGRSPRGWQPPEQLARELVAHLSELPHQRASAARFLLGLWRASEGLGLLREALSALQEAWQPACGETQSARLTSAVRRLTPEECEKLQGFLPGFTRIPWRGKPADQCPDGPRYKALGNSMAVPCMRWIGERIAAVDAIASMEAAA